MENLSSYGDFVQDLNESKKSIDTSGIRKNLMHELLNIPEGEKIADAYKSGKKLAEDLVAALKNKKIVPPGQSGEDSAEGGQESGEDACKFEGSPEEPLPPGVEVASAPR